MSSWDERTRMAVIQTRVVRFRRGNTHTHTHTHTHTEREREREREREKKKWKKKKLSRNSSLFLT